jgi:chemotaxis protein CheD
MIVGVEWGHMDSASARTTQVCGGDCLVSEDKIDLFYTVLGSCISACIYDPVAGIGGMNHYLLPHNKGNGQNARYGDEALPKLLEQLYLGGAVQHRLRAKLYGGARTLTCDADIGQMNIALAHQFLRENNIPIADTDIGGRAARCIKFHPATGRSLIRITAGKTLLSLARRN